MTFRCQSRRTLGGACPTLSYTWRRPSRPCQLGCQWAVTTNLQEKSRQDEDSSIWQIYVKSTPSYHDCHIALNTSQSPRVFSPNHITSNNQQKCTKDFIQVHDCIGLNLITLWNSIEFDSRIQLVWFSNCHGCPVASGLGNQTRAGRGGCSRCWARPG